jgi:AcrR family transcriptional regulator
MASVTAARNPGLRDRQKHKRREQILFAAAELFTEMGFDDAKLEDVAARAEVSVPTIYSYFASKSDLLLGILEIDKELMAERVEAILADPPADPIDAVTALVLAELAGGYDAGRKGVWRDLFIMRDELTLADLEAMVRREIRALFRGFLRSTSPRRSMKMIKGSLP